MGEFAFIRQSPYKLCCVVCRLCWKSLSVLPSYFALNLYQAEERDLTKDQWEVCNERQ